VPQSLVLRSGNQAVALLAPRFADGKEIQNALKLERPRGVLVLNGGTEELPSELEERLGSLLRDGLVRPAIEQQLTVVTGGTDVGIFRLFGEGLRDRATAPCIGVVPSSLVSYGTARTTGSKPGDESQVPLEPHHSHFVLIEADHWGDETEAMLSLVATLSAEAPSLAVLANGGSVSKREMLGHVRAGREVVVLAGSGRLADEITEAVAGHAAPNDAEMMEIAAGRITVFDAQAPAAALVELVHARLGSSGIPARGLRALPLFSSLPRLRWKPGNSQPFVSDSTLARCPALRADVDLLEQELVPQFRRLDEESLRTQNTFRLGQLSLIVGGTAAAALGAVQTAVGGGVVALAIPEAILAGLLAGATVYIRGRNAQREYFTARLKAERLRAEYFLALAHAGDYAGVDDSERLRFLRRRIRAIESHQEES
jgi:SLOG in TRPM, prokaryote/Protein of unknown function (DUF4231)